MSKVSWTDLTPDEQAMFAENRGCGPGKIFFLIPQFIFKASCAQHDWYYSRGGDIFDKIMADAMFYAFMLKDVADSNFKWRTKALYSLAASAYYILVSFFGIVFFKFGDYLSKEEALGISKKQ